MNAMQDFESVFSLHFMFEILAVTDDLSQVLQKKDQVIQNAMRLLNLCKCALLNLREKGWDTLLSKVIEFCVDRHNLVPNMEDIIVVNGRPRCVAQRRSFFNLNSIFCVAQKLVKTRSAYYFPLVYRLLTLALILLVATASVERVFSAMNLIKNDLRN
ncbi:uncharacterized protein LOC111375939 [Olea europaea var. sylvestris]|uniref:uncharacterized protein LOC111375939 n=1 Tax=Olea europaea var. sylvestris TaxID=158386 RepID=UPI000C1D87F6|nr:uncharacterized protein LOC111375939 [Olea europaea var. sylvestris]